MALLEVILKTTNLTLGYGKQSVLQGIELEVKTGEFWVLLGRNGGGKSTLIRALLGLVAPQEGTLWLHPQLASRARTGFVPQRCNLNPTLPTTVREFVLLGFVGLHLSRREEKERLDWTLAKLGLEEVAERNYWSLSGGERQRALVARAVVRKPTFLLLDEPTNNLDLAAEDALLQLLQQFNKDDQHTLLVVSHNVEIAERYATHVGLVGSGHLIAGPRLQVLTRENLAQIYGVAPHARALAPGKQPGDVLQTQ